MVNKDRKFTNLVFKGGGAKGCAYAGCVEVLAAKGIYKEIAQIGGTSAGAITAALLAVGAGSDGLMESVKHTNFRNFISDSWGIVGDVERLVTGYGLHTGDGFVTMLKEYFERFSGNAEVTFSELVQLANKNPEKFKNLSVIASNISQNKSQIFNAKNSPDLAIWQAVRASISIPIVFEPEKINDSLHVDGGLAWNYPIDLFDTELDKSLNDGITPVRNTATLGFYLEQKAEFLQGKDFNEQMSKIDSLGSFASSLVSFMYETSNMLHINPKDKERTVFIDDLGVSATDFSIPDNIVDQLIASGKNATESYFD